MTRNLGRSGGGGIFRDTDGHMIFVFVRYYGVKCNNIVETRALSDGLKLCAQMNIIDIEVDIDSKLVGDLMEKDRKVFWRAETYWSETRLKASSMVVRILHALIEMNGIADRLVELGTNGKYEYF